MGRTGADVQDMGKAIGDRVFDQLLEAILNARREAEGHPAGKLSHGEEVVLTGSAVEQMKRLFRALTPYKD